MSSVDISCTPHVSRIAALEQSRLDFVTAVTDEILVDVCCGKTTAIGAARSLAEFIYTEVPKASRDERRRLLSARRRTQKLSALCPEETLTVRGRGGDGLVATYEAAVGYLRSARDALSLAIEVDTKRTRALILASLKSAPVRDALAIVSSSGASALLSSPLRPGTSDARAALNYVIRSVLKPSPLSSFALVSYPGSISCRQITVSPIVDAALFDVAVQHAGTDFLAQLLPPYSRVIDDRTLAVVRIRFDLRGTTTMALRDVTAHLDDLVAARVGMGSDSVITSARVRRVYFSGLLQPGLARFSDVSGLGAAELPNSVQVAVQHRREVDQLAEELTIATGIDRVRVLSQIASSVRSAFVEMGAEPPNGVYLYETVYADEDDVRGAASARAEQYVSIGKLLMGTIYRSRAYELLAARLSTRGLVENAEEFVWCAVTDKRFMNSLHAAWTEDAAGRPTGARLTDVRLGPGMMKPAAIITHQLDEITCDMVINNIFAPDMGLLARYEQVQGAGSAVFRDGLRNAVRELYSPDTRVLAVLPHRDISPLHVGLNPPFPPLHTGEQPSAIEGVHLHNLMIAFHEPSDSVILKDAQGRNVALSYWGVSPQWIFDDMTRILLTLANPWLLTHATALRGNPFVRANNIRADNDNCPRESVDGVIYRRAGWKVLPGEYPLRSEFTSDADYLIGFEEWRNFRGIPVEAFIVLVSENPLTVRSRKPFWVSFRSLVSLYHFEDMTVGAELMWIEEVVPARRSTSTRVRDTLALVSVPVAGS